MAYRTHVGALDSYEKGLIELNDDLRKYAFSNIFEVAGAAAPFERVAVVQNLDYVAEVMRVEGDSPWYAAPHDEFALVMDGEVVFNFIKLADGQRPGPTGRQWARSPPAAAIRCCYPRARPISWSRRSPPWRSSRPSTAR
jgi:hypothetical protein